MDALTPLLATDMSVFIGLPLAVKLANLPSYFNAAIGLGLVIFFHELGHFAVAKWCNVYVERFSIGFGRPILSWKWGETEYVLGWLPFGGYVKMLGQDDADPSQLTNEEIAQDPRSYTAKTVGQRMAIISAGVIMNLITAVMLVALAFFLGVKARSPVVGESRPGLPAWKSGIRHDDVIEKINDREITTFEELPLAVALSNPPLKIVGHHKDRTPFVLENIVPLKLETNPQIGVTPSPSNRVLYDPNHQIPPVKPDTPAARAIPPFAAGDVIVAFNGTEVKTAGELGRLQASSESDSFKLTVSRSEKPGDANAPTKEVEISVKDNAFRTLGLLLDCGSVSAIQTGSPAEKAQLLEGDKFVSIDGKKIGVEIDPLRLPNEFAKRAGSEVTVVVVRDVKGGGPSTETLTIIPTDAPGWTGLPTSEGDPICIPAIGATFHTIPVVVGVVEGSAADKAGIKVGAEPTSPTRLRRMELISTVGAEPDAKAIIIEFDDVKEDKKERKSRNWAYAFWRMQEEYGRSVRLTVVEDGKERVVELSPIADPEWPLPIVMGLIREALLTDLKAKTPWDACTKAFEFTRDAVMNNYATLSGLFTGRISLTQLHGPIGIADTAVAVVQDSISKFLLFLGFLSVNLAVLNFLPIPILDGGHMVFLIWEAITRRRPSEKVVVAAQVVGMALLLSLMCFVLFLDVGRLFTPKLK